MPLGCTQDAIASLSSRGSSLPGVEDIYKGEVSALYKAMRAAPANLNLGFQLPFSSVTLPLYLWFSPTWRNHLKTLRDYLTGFIDAARKREDLIAESEGRLTTDADCMLDMFIQQELREGAEGFSSDELFDELMTMFL